MENRSTDLLISKFDFLILRLEKCSTRAIVVKSFSAKLHNDIFCTLDNPCSNLPSVKFDLEHFLRDSEISEMVESLICPFH